MSDRATFEVTEHFHLPERGAVLVGHIRTGTFRIGMRIDTLSSDHPTLTISAIEFLDNLAEQRFWNALMFREQPTLDQLIALCPVGSVLEAHAESSTKPNS